VGLEDVLAATGVSEADIPTPLLWIDCSHDIDQRHGEEKNVAALPFQSAGSFSAIDLRSSFTC